VAPAGAAVALGYGSRGDAATRIAAQITSAGGRAAALGAGLGDPAGPAELVRAAQDTLGPVDVLVSNAGMGGTKPLDEVTTADFDAMIAVNLRAPFLLAQRTLPGMADRGFGRILFVSSVAAFTGGIVGPHYAASKAGLNGLTHFLASRYAQAGVTVNGLAPALITETGMLPGDPEELRRQIPVGHQPARHGERAAHQAPGQDALEVALQPLPAQPGHREPAPADLHERVGAAHGHPPPRERERQGGRHDQAGQGQPEQHQPDRYPLRIQPVGDPGGVGPDQPHHGQQQQGLQRAPAVR